MEIFAYPHKLRDKFHIQLVDITFSLDTTTVQSNTIELLLLSFIVRKQRAVSIRGGRGGEEGWMDLICKRVNLDCKPCTKSWIDKRLNHPLANVGGDLTFSSITIVTIRFPICEFSENDHCLYLHAIVCPQIPINQYSWRQFQSGFSIGNQLFSRKLRGKSSTSLAIPSTNILHLIYFFFSFFF